MMGDDCKLLAYDPNNPGEDLSDKKYQTVVNDCCLKTFYQA